MDILLGRGINHLVVSLPFKENVSILLVLRTLAVLAHRAMQGSL